MITQMNKIFIWNCRGAASSAFYRFCKQYMESSNPEILVILETRIDPLKIKRTFSLLGFEGFISSEVRGFAGGIVVAWKESYANITLIAKSFQHIHLKVVSSLDGEWFFTPIYASPNDDTRSELWEEPFSIASSCNGKWLVAGDFNDIANQDEKKGGASINQRKCNIFWIELISVILWTWGLLVPSLLVEALFVRVILEFLKSLIVLYVMWIGGLVFQRLLTKSSLM